MMVILHKIEDEDGDYHWITTWGFGEDKLTDWRSDESFLEIAQDAFSKFGPGLDPPVMWQKGENWIISNERDDQ